MNLHNAKPIRLPALVTKRIEEGQELTVHRNATTGKYIARVGFPLSGQASEVGMTPAGSLVALEAQLKNE